MNSNEKHQSSAQKKIVFNFSQKKQIQTRDWKEEEGINSQEKIIKTNSKKKSVSFTKDVSAIPTPKKETDVVNETPNKQKLVSSSEKILKSCKEHIKTPYSKERVKEINEAGEGNVMMNGGNSSLNSNQGSKSKLDSAKKLCLDEFKDQPIDKYLASDSKDKSTPTPKKNDSFIISDNNKDLLRKQHIEIDKDNENENEKVISKSKMKSKSRSKAKSKVKSKAKSKSKSKSKAQNKKKDHLGEEGENESNEDEDNNDDNELNERIKSKKKNSFKKEEEEEEKENEE